MVGKIAEPIKLAVYTLNNLQRVWYTCLFGISFTKSSTVAWLVVLSKGNPIERLSGYLLPEITTFTRLRRQ